MKRLTAFVVATTALAAAITALAVAYTSAAPVQAQDEPYRQPIDLAVEFDEIGGGEIAVVVTNDSEVAVDDVVVNFESDPPLVDEFNPRTGRFANGKWTIPQIRAGDSANLWFGQKTDGPNDVSAVRFFQARASIVSSSPQETRGLEYNNRAEKWFVAATGNIGFSRDGVGLQVEVDDLRPAPDGRTVFKVSAKNTIFISRLDTPTWDKTGVQVKVTLSPGLSFASSNLSGTTISGNTAIWRAGDLLAVRLDDRRTKTLSIPVNLSGNAPLERRCLTAEIVQATPPDSEDRSFDDVATVCLGDGPTEVINSGEFDLMKYVQCIGVTTYPCSTDDTLELVAEFNLNDWFLRLKQRRDDTSALPTSTDLGEMFLQPESVIIHVEDPLGRHDGKWRTGTTSAHSSHYLRSHAMPGAGLLMRLIPSGYSQYSFAISDVEPKQRPGAFTLLGGPAAGGAFLDVDTKPSNGPLDLPESVTSAPFALIAEFSTLGTYKVQLTFGATTSGTPYTDTVVYTFHVGPIAELEVRDGGASPEVARGKRAYTIEAVNNGPDAAAGVEVTLADVPEGARVEAGQGSYTQAACQDGLCEGVWTIDELAAPETASLFGQSNSATLAIIADGDPITATIESARDYTVCINSDGADVAASSRSACEAGGNSWHSGEYYDHSTSDCFDSDGKKVDESSRSKCETTNGNGWYSNDRDVRIASQPGTGQGHPDAPASLRVDKFGPLALLRWQPVERVNGWPVTHYQVERNGAMLAEEIGGLIYADLQGGTVNQSYRVRAVNELGVPGPWSLPAGASGPLEQPEELGAPTGLTATPGSGVGRIDLSWFAPSEDSGLRYIIEHSPDGAGPWRTLVRSQSGTTYSHTGLLLGTTHYYRVAALKGDLISAWAYVQATTEGLQIYAPERPENLRFSSLERTAVTLVWDPPVDDGGSPVTGYEYRVFGPCASGAGTCDIVAPTRLGRTTTSRRITGLNREGTYQFEVRALNAVGASDWSHITKDVGPETAGGGRVILSPSRLTVTEGGEATYRVKLSTEPTLPLYVVMHWDGDGYDNLAVELPVQQFKILLPRGYDTSGMPEWCSGIRLDWDEAYAWNVGVPITVVAAEDEDTDHDSLTIRHTIYTLSAECLNMDPDEWAADPVYDDMHGIALTVTERDTGSNSPSGNTGRHGPTGNTGVVGSSAPGPGSAQPTAVALVLDAATASESAGEVTLTATLDAPAPEGGIGGFLFAGADGTASQDIDFTMPLGFFIPGGQRSATAAISITGDDLDEEDETVVLSALFDIGTALLEDRITLTIADDDTAGVTVSAASGLEVAEGGSATYAVVLDSQPTSAVTITPYIPDTDAVAVSPASYTFTPSDWHTPLTFTVRGLADDDTNDESVEIIQWITSDDWKYAVAPLATVLVTVTDTGP